MDRLMAAEVFVESVARGSISAAAEHLGMSRAMASRYVNLMEEWTGARILHRTTRKLSLTSVGAEVLIASKDMLAIGQSVKALGTQASTQLRGQLRVSATAIFAQFCLTEVLMEFQEVHPGVQIDLQIIDRTVNLVEDGIDLALRLTNSLDPNLVARRMRDFSSVVCASPKYLEQNGTPELVEELSNHRCLMYAHYGLGRWKFNVNGKSIDVPVKGNFSTNEALIVLHRALHGGGIALLPEFSVAELIKTGQLINLFPHAAGETLSVFAVFLTRNRMPPALRALIDFLNEKLSLPQL